MIMSENRDRIDEFRRDLDEQSIGVPSASGERWLLVGGLVLVGLGGLLIIGGWWGASGEGTIVEQFPYLVSGGIGGLACVVAGSVLFARYSMTRYMRYWLIRIIYEQRTQTDRMIEASGGPRDSTSADPTSSDTGT
jgi:hypothetical protein